MRCGRKPNAAAVPATVSDEPEPKATGQVREGGKGSDPRARRPAVVSNSGRIAASAAIFRMKTDRPAGVPDRETMF